MADKTEMVKPVIKMVDLTENRKLHCSDSEQEVNVPVENNGIYQAIGNNFSPGCNNFPGGYTDSLNSNYPYSNAWNVMLQKQNGILMNQCILNNQMNGVNYRVDQVISKVRKEHRKIVDYIIYKNQTDGLIIVQKYDDGSCASMPFILEPYGPLKLTKLSIGDERYIFIIIELGNYSPIIMRLSDMKPSTVFLAFAERGVRFNPCIPKIKASQALYDFLIMEANNCKYLIKDSGYSGWERGCFRCAEDFWYLNDYKSKVMLPVLEKHFDKNTANISRLDDYKNCLCQIHRADIRLQFALIPFAGILYTPLIEKGIYEPFVVNIVLMSKKLKIADIAQFFQVFNREHISACSVDDRDKNIQSVIDTSKDDVILFAGIQDSTQSNYKNQKVTNNLNMIAQNALGRNGVGYGKHDVQSLVVLISDQLIMQKGVKNIFVSDDLFNDDETNVLGRLSIQSVLALFIRYAEEHWKELDNFILGSHKVHSKAERYWKSLISIVNDFMKSTGKSLNEVLGLSSDFQFSFLWQEEEYDFEKGTEVVVAAVRKAMANIRAVPKTYSTGGEQFIYDDKDIWISPQLFSEILDNLGLKLKKERILLECKIEGFLKTNKYGGYTERLQIKNIRKEYYRFERERFNGIGQVEIISLSKGGISNAN